MFQTTPCTPWKLDHLLDVRYPTPLHSHTLTRTPLDLGQNCGFCIIIKIIFYLQYLLRRAPPSGPNKLLIPLPEVDAIIFLTPSISSQIFGAQQKRPREVLDPPETCFLVVSYFGRFFFWNNFDVFFDKNCKTTVINRQNFRHDGRSKTSLAAEGSPSGPNKFTDPPPKSTQ